tara:strand:+ start:784 stop:996 length:213 start_codon:yes stop_codon:yes gene_type:complete
MFTFVKTLVSLTSVLVGWLNRRSLMKLGENKAINKGLADAYKKLDKVRNARSNIDRKRLRNKFRSSSRDD